MKDFIARSLLSLFLGVLALGSTVQAQRPERTIKATIPFEFSVGSQTFPAGTYWLVSTAPAFLQLRDRAGHTLATVLTNSVQSLNNPASPKLRFNSEGGQYRLAQVWQENDSTGEQLQPARTAANLAKRRSKPAPTVAASNSQ